ncbi:hypothetical protein SeMB42_g03781 [Synchytrium endobioticum]|uniref:Golgi apparatus membrane protein TVP18 n=1 Tax=Synchytrium endobioticum TaxID=286115 RepID=A0A507D4K1_9FUNG|nr:hypothetical protein SeMB42_g03781 [Synchytrium endobioticum]TPX48324.1 hypothetical protein SeLEV6574_g02081 [Synchytrium endobioticum]TPX48345.1 hypothetical protein SeLEV6574_g02092 [Synchytrium endobioticum]
MTVLDEIKSGHMTFYAQWAAILSIIFLIVFGIMNILGNPIFSIIGWGIAFVLIFLEIPMLARCCPSNPTFDNFIKFFERNSTRVFLYAAFAVLEWLSVLIRADTIILCAITLTATFVFYVIAMFKGETPMKSGFTGGSGIGP